MKENLSFTDRQFRVILGSIFVLGVMFAAPTPIGYWSLLILAAVPIITTGIVGWDPLYALFSWRTRNQGSIRQKHWSYANVGRVDKMVRYAISASIFLAVLFGETGPLTVFLAIPVMMTAIMAWDPIYAMADVNTLASRRDAAEADDIEEEQLSVFYDLSDQQAANDEERKFYDAA